MYEKILSALLILTYQAHAAWNQVKSICLTCPPASSHAEGVTSEYADEIDLVLDENEVANIVAANEQGLVPRLLEHVANLQNEVIPVNPGLNDVGQDPLVAFFTRGGTLLPQDQIDSIFSDFLQRVLVLENSAPGTAFREHFVSNERNYAIFESYEPAVLAIEDSVYKDLKCIEQTERRFMLIDVQDAQSAGKVDPAGNLNINIQEEFDSLALGKIMLGVSYANDVAHFQAGNPEHSNSNEMDEEMGSSFSSHSNDMIEEA